MQTQILPPVFLEYLPFFIPVILIQFSLQIYSIINLIKRKRVRFDNKLLWGICIIVFGMLGSICYLLLRGEEE